MARSRTHNPEEYLTDFRQNVGYFEPDPYLALGDSDSAHGVMFGEMADIGQVAVKPFTKPGKAERENAELIKIRQKGFEAIEPIAVAQGGLASYLVSIRYPGLQHMGQVNWHSNIASQKQRRVIEPNLVLAADTLAAWHNRAVFNGDAQPKNLAFNLEGTSVYVDAERAQLDPDTRALATHMGNKDLYVFGQTVVKDGLLEDRSPRYRAAYLDEHLLAPYLEAVDPNSFAMSPQERQQAITRYWVEAASPRSALPQRVPVGV